MNDIVICDKGRVTFSDSEEWHLQDDDWFFEMASKTAILVPGSRFSVPGSRFSVPGS